MMREMRCFWFIAALFMVANFAFAQREFRSASRFEPPVENFRANISLETIQDLLERKDFNQATAQVESLLKSNADEITSGDERSLISISNWMTITPARLELPARSWVSRWGIFRRLRKKPRATLPRK